MSHAACPSLNRLNVSRGACAGRHVGYGSRGLVAVTHWRPTRLTPWLYRRCVAGHRARGRVSYRGLARTQVREQRLRVGVALLQPRQHLIPPPRLAQVTVFASADDGGEGDASDQVRSPATHQTLESMSSLTCHLLRLPGLQVCEQDGQHVRAQGQRQDGASVCAADRSSGRG